MGHACTYRITGMNLERACLAYGIELGRHHDGACDAEACARLFLRYLAGGIEAGGGEERPVRPRPAEAEAGGPGRHERISGELLTWDLSAADPGNPFYGKRVVITGVFGFGRVELARMLRSAGAKLCATVTRRTDFVVAGAEAGWSKMETVRRLRLEGHGITVLSEADLTRMLTTN